MDDTGSPGDLTGLSRPLGFNESGEMKRPNRSLPSTWSQWLIWGIVLLAFALRLWRLDVQDIWWDEARNIDVAGRPIAAIFNAPELDIHPPGYFLLLHGWLKVAGTTPFATRFFSTWFGVLLIPLVVVLCRRLGWKQSEWGAALYAALAPFLIGEAQETRMYTLAFVLVAAGAWLFWRVWHEKPYAWIGLGGLLAAAPLVHYSTVFVMVAWYVFAAGHSVWTFWRLRHFDRKTQKRLRNLGGAACLAGVLYLPQIFRAIRQIAPYGNPNLHVPSVSEYLVALWQAYTVGQAAEGGWVPYSLIACAIIIAVFLLEMRSAGKNRDTFAFTVTALILPVALYYVVLIDRATFAPRYIAFVTPFLALIWGRALAWWWRFRLLGTCATLFLAGLLVAGIHADQFNPAFFREDTSGLASWLMQEATSDDVILVDVPYPLGFYYPKFSKDPTVPPAGPAELAPAYYLFVDVYTVAERLNTVVPGKRRVFWVQWYKSDTDPRGLVPFLLQKYGFHVGEKAFRGYRVDIYQVPPSVRFAVASTWESKHITFEGGIAVTGISAGQASPLDAEIGRRASEPRPVWVTVKWRREGNPEKPYKASVRLWNPAGHQIAQDDRLLLNDRHLSIPYWESGEEAINVYLIPLPLGTPPGTYTITVRVYEPESLEPLSVVAAERVIAGSDAVVGRVVTNRPRRFPALEPFALHEAPLALVEADTVSAEVAPGTLLPVSLLWRSQQSHQPPLSLRFVLRDDEGGPVAGWESPPVPWYPTTEWVEGEIVRSRLEWPLPPDLPPGDYTVELYEVEPTRTWGPVELGRVRVRGRVRLFDSPPVDFPLQPSPTFGNVGQLVGYNVKGSIAPGNRLMVTLVWRALATTDISYTGFVQLLGPQNQVIAQEDHIPRRGEAPTTSWIAGEFVQDEYELHLPEALPPGPYRLIAGLYDSGTMQRVPVNYGLNEPEGDHVLLLNIPDPASMPSAPPRP